MTISLRKLHSEEKMCNVVSRLLNLVDGVEWNKKVIAILTKNVFLMVGHVPESFTNLQRQTLFGLYRV